ncbi:MAG: transcription-repair coupling factor, partial [Dehalococcoidia bacterium]|nr:transcription-repair coupling factor [Dehalococcoidia bacterium]
REMLIPGGLSAAEAMGGLDFSKCQPESRQKFADEMGRLLGGDHFFGMEFYAGMFDRGNLLDYLPQDALVIVDEPKQLQESLETLDAQAEEMRRAQVDRGELPPDFTAPYLRWPELAEKLSALSSRLSLAEWEMEPQARLDFASTPGYSGRVEGFIKEARRLLESERRVIVVSQQASRLSEMLQDQDIFASPVSALSQVPSPGGMAIVHGSLSAGWQSEEAGLTLITDSEIFGFVKQRRPARKRPVRHEEFLAEIAAGDYVVHIEHGIARFAGTKTMRAGDEEREYLVLEYASDDRLYVPTEQVDRVTRYVGPGGYTPSLSRLGTQEWNKTKQRVKEATAQLARELLALYASRETLPGYAFSPDTVWQHELESSFPFVETPDQLTAVQQVKQDMERPRPMDRLVCGDVGYGKTEVALRAAFKAAMDGKQVAILVPTTVLAQQHFNTFTQRLSPFPVRVEALSRLRSPKEQQEVVEAIKNGAADIVIGTHRLLQKDISFKDLGLAIIDEEQRFGVAHKERLKQMRKEVDVLTLTATPIPRTLHMALVSIRDMSTIETPPEERLPIKTYVAEYEDRLVREAILREIDRGGQVFFVHNRVQTIPGIAQKLRGLVPEARISVGHGQMPDEDLEAVMLDFSKGNSDVLVCSTIIESGLDLPNVNTLIINDAHRLGLTQMYQLRGRVGRGSNRAYAYFLYPKGRQLTETARQRLKTIFEATELGAGFRIAMKDLEIRGAGNILGPEQSGQIGAVGFTFYTKLLAEAVQELRGALASGSSLRKNPAPSVTLKLSARLPEEYIPDLSARLALYQRLAAMDSPDQAADLAQELVDRFGKLPEQVEALLYVVKVRCLSSMAGVSAVNQQDSDVVVQMAEGRQISSLRLLKVPIAGIKIGLTQLRLDGKRLGARLQSRLVQVLEAL